jgi:hypothetical protein
VACLQGCPAFLQVPASAALILPCLCMASIPASLCTHPATCLPHVILCTSLQRKIKCTHHQHAHIRVSCCCCLSCLDQCCSPCEQCPEGRYTEYIPGDGSYQSSINSCKVLPGRGVYSAASSDAWAPEQRSASMNARPCPVGLFSPGEDASVNETSNPICQQCPGLESTAEEGGTSCNGELNSFVTRSHNISAADVSFFSSLSTRYLHDTFGGCKHSLHSLAFCRPPSCTISIPTPCWVEHVRM